MVVVDPAATGRAGTAGVYRSPSSLPDGEILASYAANVSDPATRRRRYDLVAVRRADGRAPHAAGRRPALSLVEAALGYKRAERLLFRNLPQLVFGGRRAAAGGDRRVMHFPDLPMLATLLGANLRRGRNVAPMDDAARAAGLRGAPAVGPRPRRRHRGRQSVFTQRTVARAAPLRRDGSLKVAVPARQAAHLRAAWTAAGRSVFTMTEEHQVRRASTSPRARRASCSTRSAAAATAASAARSWTSPSRADALTGASASRSRDPGILPKVLQ